ncbi:four helix bundle protein [Flaviaesturariibacter aridisoli]|uniref:Four helix bundle protein n=1 Tax=Flaviaesturariibacter aridisoli TaxID=2545761 RepID=A0A4R4E373_9BACT|nr:four helix bundle protein [Flaviaesturariibacter aridisoli]TCZ70450.1 four helix bundle protein [Flaviaesturariibacter aridisoli]
MNQKVVDLETRLIAFAARMVIVSANLPKTAAAKHFSDQLVRSGTAPALLYGEAQGAESRADFVHKMKVALKELKETFINLRIIRVCRWIPEEELAADIIENNELISIFVSSIKTAVGKPTNA